MREPLPLYCRTSAAWAEAVVSGGDPARAASGQWESDWKIPREDRDPAHLLVLGAVLPFDALVAEPPREDERGGRWEPGETSRFGRYARRLWDDLLAGEQVTDR
jgi:exodeoxyribonuclease V gamma subunit